MHAHTHSAQKIISLLQIWVEKIYIYIYIHYNITYVHVATIEKFMYNHITVYYTELAVDLGDCNIR